jgi:signal transduction histidine kinase
VSHDLRAPLRAISGYAVILVEEHQEDLDPEAQNYLDRISAAVLKMNDLIEDLLNLSRVSREIVNKERVNLSLLVEEILKEIDPRFNQLSPTVEISPEVYAECDPGLVRIVLTNLLENAFKFSIPTGKIQISFGTELQRGKPVYFVRDQGIGFPAEKAETLFDVFSRYHEDIQGTGIGLSIVRRIINKHGGSIWAEGSPGEGSTFFFTL